MTILTTTIVKECQAKRAQGQSLKQIANELGVPWQRIYSALKRADAKADRTTVSKPAASVEVAAKTDRDESGLFRMKFDSITDTIKASMKDYGQSESNRKLLTDFQNEALSGESRWGNYYTRAKFDAALVESPQELIDSVTELKNELLGDLALPTQPRRRVRRGLDNGDDINADRWLDRDPNCWERSVREPTTRKVLKLGINLAICGGAQPCELLYRGAAALALTDVLIERGESVEITLFHSSSGFSTAEARTLGEILVKSADMPLDVGSLAFAACEVAFFRVVVLFAEARMLKGKVTRGLGRPITMPAQIASQFDFLIDSDVLSRSAATDWLRSKLSVAN